jgi:hypothetical protein
MVGRLDPGPNLLTIVSIINLNLLAERAARWREIMTVRVINRVFFIVPSKLGLCLFRINVPWRMHFSQNTEARFWQSHAYNISRAVCEMNYSLYFALFMRQESFSDKFGISVWNLRLRLWAPADWNNPLSAFSALKCNKLLHAQQPHAHTVLASLAGEDYLHFKRRKGTKPGILVKINGALSQICFLL